MANPVRLCPGCNQADDHPRHVITLADQSTANYHMDCCAAIRGCEVCAHQLADAAGVTGAALREHLVSLPAQAVEHHADGSVTVTTIGES